MDEIKLLEEYTEINGDTSRIVTEQKEGRKTCKIRGCFSRAGVKNLNGRYYPKEVMKEAVEAAQEAIKDGRFIAELEHPSSLKINIAEIAAKVESLTMLEDGSVVGEMTVLDTPKGKIIQELVESGVKLGVSTRGNGSVKKVKMDLGEGVMEDVDLVQNGFRLHAIDVVFNPSANQYGKPDFIYEGYEGGTKSRKLFDVWKENFS